MIPTYDGSDSVCDEKLDAAKQQANILQDCNDPNVVKYVSQFQIDKYYFIQMEKCEYTLQEFVENKNHKEFALQILHAIQYIHEKNYVLKDISLKNILLDSKKQIKLSEFGLTKQIIPQKKIQSFLTPQEIGTFFYFPPEFLQLSNQLDNQTKAYSTIEGDVWSFGICMYILAGASFNQVQQLTQGLEQYQIQSSIHIEINQILLNILKRIPNERPTIKQIIDSFSKLRTNKEDKEQELICDVQNYFDIFDFNSSIGLLQELIEMSPENDQYSAMLGKAYLELSKIDESIVSSMKSIEMNPQNDIALSNLGYCYYINNDIQKSVTYLNKSLEINPKNYMALTYMSYIKEETQIEESIQLFLQSLSINPNYINAYCGLGNAYLNQNKYEESIQWYKKALQINPNCEYAHTQLGDLYGDLSNYDLSIECYKKALQINPNNEVSQSNLGKVYYSQDKYDLSIECYKKALQINPNYLYAHNGLGEVYYTLNEFDLSIECQKKALQINPNCIHAHGRLGDIYYDLNNYDLSIECYKEAQKLNPNNELTHTRLGNVYYSQNQYDLSIECHKKALQINKNYVYAHNGLGDVYYQQNKYDLSIVSYKKALQINPNQFHSRFELGYCYFQQELYDLAYQQFLKSLQVKPSTETKNRLEICKKKL